jgi:hypothetical protein
MKQKRQLKKGGNLIQNIFKENTILIPTNTTDLYDKILEVLNTKITEPRETDEELTNNNKEISKFLYELNQIPVSGRNIFVDIANIVAQYDITNEESINFQSVIEDSEKSLFPLYELFTKEDPQHFITIDPTIIQIMIFDPNIINTTDIVYSLKLILRGDTKLTIRYTTQLFPKNTDINFESADPNILTNFNNFNINLDTSYFEESKYINELQDFLKKYIKYYTFYKKCYTFNLPEGKTNTLIDYQLRYISILGKARFSDIYIQAKTALVSDYIMSNLLFTSPYYAFISGGYKGFKSNKYGVTRSGYEIAKKYNRPILTIMCKEGLHDYHQYSDATLIYGEHWGEDSIALSQFTDGAIIIAPFGGWTYIECLTLLKNKKIVGIYNDLYNILNYDDNKKNYDQFNFFKFFNSEQNSIINYYINYYLILIRLYISSNNNKLDKINEDDKIECLSYAIKLLKYLLELLPIATNKYKAIDDIEKKIQDLLNKTNTDIEIETLNEIFQNDTSEIEKFKDLNNINNKENVEILKKYIISKSEKDINRITYLKTFNELNNYKTNKIKEFIDDSNVKIIIEIINYFNKFKTHINNFITEDFKLLNIEYRKYIKDIYQLNIPENCDGIWIKPKFNISDNCIINREQVRIDKEQEKRDKEKEQEIINANQALWEKIGAEHIAQKKLERNTSREKARQNAINIRNKKRAAAHSVRHQINALDNIELNNVDLISEPQEPQEPQKSQEQTGGSAKKYKQYKKCGGKCDIEAINAIINDGIAKYNINYSNIINDPIFNKDIGDGLNNNIIFVFSDIMYLNIYLNENLNTPHYQTRLQVKINNLKNINLSTSLNSGENQYQLIRAETQKNLALDKRIDGHFNIEKNKIILDDIIRANYTFIIKDECSDYSKLLH